MRPASWLPAVGWTAVILILSSDVGGAEHTGRVLRPFFAWLWPGASPGQLEAVHVLVRKAAHLTEYAILAVLWHRAFSGGGLAPGRSATAALGLSVALAGVDELHQGFLTVSRGGSAGDVALDTTGALLALLVVAPAPAWRRAFDAVVTALLAVAIVGGVAALALNAAAGVASGVLWITTPLAALLLAGLRLLPRRRPRDRPDRD